MGSGGRGARGDAHCRRDDSTSMMPEKAIDAPVYTNARIICSTASLESLKRAMGDRYHWHDRHQLDGLQSADDCFGSRTQQPPEPL